MHCSKNSAKDVLKTMFTSGKTIDNVIEEKGLVQVSDDGTLEKLVNEIIEEHKKIADHRHSDDRIDPHKKIPRKEIKGKQAYKK